MQPNACTVQKLKGDMANPQQSGVNKDLSQRPRDDLPPEILEIIFPALQVGGLVGMFVGFLVYLSVTLQIVLDY